MNLDFNKNEDSLKLAYSQVKQHLDKIYEGGGKKAAEKQKEKNKLTPRERIDYLKDNDKPFIEIGAFAGYGMYEEYGGCPAGGTVAGIGYISGRQCVIVANDQTVKAGAWFPITGKKNLRMQEIAMDRRYNDFQASQANDNSRGWIIEENAKREYFPATVRWGGSYVQDTNINNLNRFLPQDLDTVDRSKGDIRRFKARDRVLRVLS